MVKSEFEVFKTGALLRIYYFDLYSKLEKVIRRLFEECQNELEIKIKNKLYFYLGANHMQKFGLEYEDDKATTTHKKFKENELFNDFPIAKVIKLNKKDNFIKNLNFKIPSINRSSVELSFSEIAVKLVNMRNVLAHEPTDFTYTEKVHIVEILSLSKIEELNTFNLDGYNLSHSDEQNLQILSNLIYMQNVYNKLIEVEQ